MATTVNGYSFSHASAQVIVAGKALVSIQTLNYSRKRNRSTVYGTGSEPVGMTRGQSEYSCTLELTADERKLLLDRLAARTDPNSGDYMDAPFQVVATFEEPGLPRITDTIYAVGLQEFGIESAVGTDPTKVSVPLDVIRIDFDRRSPFQRPA